MKAPYRYVELADKVQSLIESKAYLPGDRLPGTRKLAELYQMSINTVLQAQRLLEQRGLIEALPRSGFFVSHAANIDNAEKVSEPRQNLPNPKPQLVGHQSLVMDLIAAAHAPGLTALGAALPHPSFFPNTLIKRYFAKALRREQNSLTSYSFPPGDARLRSLLAKKMTRDGLPALPEEIVITNGCHDAILLALKLVTKPFDIVALESPSYYGILHALEAMQLRAIEIPNSGEGIPPELLVSTLDKWPVRAFISVANFSNPTGSLPNLERKKALAEVLDRRGIPLIEDDIYGDLAFSGERPLPVSTLLKKAEAIYCNSFSKTLAPGLRVGWLHSKAHAQKVRHLKFAQSLGSSVIEQIALGDYLQQGHYSRHIRQLQKRLAVQIRSSSLLIERLFPAVKVSRAKGGFVLWLELAKHFDSYQLYHDALAKGVSIAPGPVFSSQEKFTNCFRLNCAHPWETLEPALELLAELCWRQN